MAVLGVVGEEFALVSETIVFSHEKSKIPSQTRQDGSKTPFLDPKLSLCMLASKKHFDACGDTVPIRRHRCQALVAAQGQAVIVAAAALDLLAAARDEFFLLQGMQRRINAPFAKGEMPAGFGFDGADDFVAIHLAAGEQFEQEQFRHAVEEIRIRFLHVARVLHQTERYCQPQTVMYIPSQS